MNKNLIETALSYYGVHESSIAVNLMFKSIGLEYLWDNGKTPWCAAFVGHVLTKAGYKAIDTLHARDYLTYPNTALIPRIGDICILWREKKDGKSGHIGFYITSDKTGVYILGGNQSNKVCVARYPKSRVLGFRVPEKLK